MLCGDVGDDGAENINIFIDSRGLSVDSSDLNHFPHKFMLSIQHILYSILKYLNTLFNNTPQFPSMYHAPSNYHVNCKFPRLNYLTIASAVNIDRNLAPTTFRVFNFSSLKRFSCRNVRTFDLLPLREQKSYT